jgi:hypothetical protein
LPDSP